MPKLFIFFFCRIFLRSKEFKTFLDFFTRSPGTFTHFVSRKTSVTRQKGSLRPRLQPAACFTATFSPTSNHFYLLLTSFLSYVVSVARIAILSPKAAVLMSYILTRLKKKITKKNILTKKYFDPKK